MAKVGNYLGPRGGESAASERPVDGTAEPSLREVLIEGYSTLETISFARILPVNWFNGRFPAVPTDTLGSMKYSG